MIISVPLISDCSDQSYDTDVPYCEARDAGADRINAVRVGRYWYYLADETSEVYRLTGHELAQLGAGEIDGRGADYSLWCSQTGRLISRPHARVRAALGIS